MSDLLIDAEDARKLDGAVFIDARNPHDWGEADTKLPGAVRIPANELDAHEDQIRKDQTYITYCT